MASTKLANCGKLIHSAQLVCRRDKLGPHQVVFEVGGAVMDNSAFFLDNIVQLSYCQCLNRRCCLYFLCKKCEDCKP